MSTFFHQADKEMEEEEEDDVMKEVSKMSTDEVVARTRLLDNDIRIMKSEIVRISHEKQAQEDKIKENTEKIKVSFDARRIMKKCKYVFLGTSVKNKIIHLFCRYKLIISLDEKQVKTKICTYM